MSLSEYIPVKIRKKNVKLKKFFIRMSKKEGEIIAIVSLEKLRN